MYCETCLSLNPSVGRSKRFVGTPSARSMACNDETSRRAANFKNARSFFSHHAQVAGVKNTASGIGGIWRIRGGVWQLDVSAAEVGLQKPVDDKQALNWSVRKLLPTSQVISMR